MKNFFDVNAPLVSFLQLLFFLFSDDNVFRLFSLSKKIQIQIENDHQRSVHAASVCEGITRGEVFPLARFMNFFILFSFLFHISFFPLLCSVCCSSSFSFPSYCCCCSVAAASFSSSLHTFRFVFFSSKNSIFLSSSFAVPSSPRRRRLSIAFLFSRMNNCSGFVCVSSAARRKNMLKVH